MIKVHERHNLCAALLLEKVGSKSKALAIFIAIELAAAEATGWDAAARVAYTTGGEAPMSEATINVISALIQRNPCREDV